MERQNFDNQENLQDYNPDTELMESISNEYARIVSRHPLKGPQKFRSYLARILYAEQPIK